MLFSTERHKDSSFEKRGRKITHMLTKGSQCGEAAHCIITTICHNGKDRAMEKVK